MNFFKLVSKFRHAASEIGARYVIAAIKYSEDHSRDAITIKRVVNVTNRYGAGAMKIATSPVPQKVVEDLLLKEGFDTVIESKIIRGKSSTLLQAIANSSKDKVLYL